jgi:cytochrome P450
MEISVEQSYPVSDVDPFSTAFLTDPYPYHAALRDAGPLVRLSRYNVWAVARYEENVAVLTDPKTYCSSAGVGLSDFRKETPWRRPSIILEADPPLHTRTHKVLMRVLAPQALRDLRPMLEREAERLADELVARERFDAVADAGRAYPLKVFPDAVGLRPEGRENLLPYGNMAFNAFGPRNERLAEAMANAEPVIRWITENCERSALRPDGLGAHVYGCADSGEITEEEAGLLVRSILTAGLDTTVNAIGNALLCFARFPDQWDAVREDPSIVRTAFDEVMRFESPVQTFFRTTTREVELAGVRIGEGEKILMFLASGNRDPRRWEDPDRFDVRRRTGGHLGFGFGIHRCVGEMLAKLEGETFLTALARRVRRFALDGEPVMRYNNTLRGWDSIPLRITSVAR